jgi:hypothetical protein
MYRIIIFCLGTVSVFAQEKDWAKKNRSDKFPDARYLQAVGVGSSADEAKNQAFIKLAQTIEVKIQGEQTYSSTEKITGKTGETASSMTEQTRAKVDLQLQGLRIEDTDYNKKNKTYYALAVLDRKVAGDALKAEIADRDRRFRGFLEQGQKAFQSKQFYQAVEKLQICMSDLLAIDRRLKKLRIIMPDDSFENGIVRIDEEAKISSMVDEMSRDETTGNLDVVCAILMYKLYRSMTLSGSDLRVVFGNFTYQNTKMSSSFSAYFKGKIEVELGKISGLNVVKENVLSQLLKSKAKEYEGTAKSMAQVTESDAAILGSYWELDDKVEVRLQAISQVTGEAMGNANVSFPARYVPKSIHLHPDNFTLAQNDLEILKDSHRSPELDITVWTDRGDGAVYRENEGLKIYLKSNKTCYVTAVYHDAGGNNILIYPNDLAAGNVQIQGGQVFELGGRDTPFEFTVAPPFGTELIKVFASDRPLPALSELQPVGNGMYAIGLKTADLVNHLRQQTKTAMYTETSVSLTTVKGQ